MIEMRLTNLDLDALRSFALGVELGSFAKAAVRLNRSTSAVSAHLKKLEDQTGQVILYKSGRGLQPTAAGERLLSYARRLLELNDEVITLLNNTELEGIIRLGLQEDFSAYLLSDVLGRFSRIHPKAHIEVRVARNAELLELITLGRLDLAVTWEGGIRTPFFQQIGQLPLHWIGATKYPFARANIGQEPLPLVMFEAPCVIRKIGIAALDLAGIPWRIAVTSQSLAGIWAAVGAGLGVTIRTRIEPSDTLSILVPEENGLPPLPILGINMHYANDVGSSAVNSLKISILESMEKLF